MEPLDRSLENLVQSMAELRKGRAAFETIKRNLTTTQPAPLPTPTTAPPNDDISILKHDVDTLKEALEEARRAPFVQIDNAKQPQLTEPVPRTQDHTADLNPASANVGLDPKRSHTLSRIPTAPQPTTQSQPSLGNHHIPSHAVNHMPSHSGNHMPSHSGNHIPPHAFTPQSQSSPPIVVARSTPLILPGRPAHNRTASANAALQRMDIIDIQTEIENLREALQAQSAARPPVHTSRLAPEPSALAQRLQSQVQLLERRSMEKENHLKALNRQIDDAKANLQSSQARNHHLEQALRDLRAPPAVTPSLFTNVEPAYQAPDPRTHESAARRELERITRNTSSKVPKKHKKPVKKNPGNSETAVLRTAVKLAVEEAEMLKSKLVKAKVQKKTAQSAIKRAEAKESAAQAAETRTKALAEQRDVLQSKVVHMRQLHEKTRTHFNKTRHFQSLVADVALDVKKKRDSATKAAYKLQTLKSTCDRERVEHHGKLKSARRVAKMQCDSDRKSALALQRRLKKLAQATALLEQRMDTATKRCNAKVLHWQTQVKQRTGDTEREQDKNRRVQDELDVLQRQIKELQEVSSAKDLDLEQKMTDVESMEANVHTAMAAIRSLEATFEKLECILSSLRQDDLSARRATDAMEEEFDRISEELSRMNDQDHANHRTMKGLSNQVLQLQKNAEANRVTVRRLVREHKAMDVQLETLERERDSLTVNEAQLLENCDNEEHDVARLEETLAVLDHQIDVLDREHQSAAELEARKANLLNEEIEHLAGETKRLGKEAQHIQGELEGRARDVEVFTEKRQHELETQRQMQVEIERLEQEIQAARQHVDLAGSKEEIQLQAQKAEADFVWSQLQVVLDSVNGGVRAGGAEKVEVPQSDGEDEWGDESFGRLKSP